MVGLLPTTPSNARTPLQMLYNFRLDIIRYNDYIPSMSSTQRPSRSSASLEAHAFVSLQKAADGLAQQVEQLLKANDLTAAQYNALRILRGAEPEGLACSSIADRMISHDPDMTRLLDRMEKRALITRERQKDDRRVVKTRITSQGLDLLKGLDAPVHDMHKSQFAHVPGARLKLLIELLDQVLEKDPSARAKSCS
jgi:DNA-binding MarR family transcriptional regulator